MQTGNLEYLKGSKKSDRIEKGQTSFHKTYIFFTHKQNYLQDPEPNVN